MNGGRTCRKGLDALRTGGASLLLALGLGFGSAAMASGQEQENAKPEFAPSTASDEDSALMAAQRQISAGRIHEGIATLQHAMQEDDGGDVGLLARRLGTLGLALIHAGAYGQAIEVQHRALALYVSPDEAAGPASAIMLNLGIAMRKLHDHVGARRFLQDALALKQRHGIWRGVGMINQEMADMAEEDGDLAGARAALEQALAAYATVPDPTSESLARSALAGVLAKLGDLAGAMEQIALAETLARTHNHDIGMLYARRAHAFALMQRARTQDVSPQEYDALLAQAETSLHQALATTQDRDDQERSIALRVMLSDLRQMQGHPEQALEALRQVREQEAQQQHRIGMSRANALSAVYEHQRQLREIQDLRDQKVHNDARLTHQRRGLWLLAGLFLLASVSVLALWYRSRTRQSAAAQLQEHNRELSLALEQAHQERHRTETFALRQRRFLRLASEDLRGPLLEVRTLAERALVEEKPDILRRSHATIAQHAADLIWVTEQMVESATHEAGTDAPRPAEEVDLVPMLRELVDEAAPRALHRDQHLALQCQAATAPVRVERTRCSVALRELIDILLYLNPARTRLAFALQRTGGEVRIGLDAGVARLPDWQDIALGQESGDVTLRLALAWIQHTIQDNEGHIETERHAEPGQRRIVIRFPLVQTG